jgi:hypothetical protein
MWTRRKQWEHGPEALAMTSACAIHEECTTRFFSGEASSETEFARDLLRHVDALYKERRLTSQFLRIAFDALAKSTAVDARLMAAMDGAVACVAAWERNAQE